MGRAKNCKKCDKPADSINPKYCKECYSKTSGKSHITEQNGIAVGDRVMSFSLQCNSGQMGVVQEIHPGAWFAWVQFDNSPTWRGIELAHLETIDDRLQTPEEIQGKPAIAALPTSSPVVEAIAEERQKIVQAVAVPKKQLGKPQQMTLF